LGEFIEPRFSEKSADGSDTGVSGNRKLGAVLFRVLTHRPEFIQREMSTVGELPSTVAPSHPPLANVFRGAKRVLATIARSMTKVQSGARLLEDDPAGGRALDE